MKRQVQKPIGSGSVVSLISGGPRMTFSRMMARNVPPNALVADDVPYAHCIWFDADGKERSGDFPVATLEQAALTKQPRLTVPRFGSHTTR